MAFNIRNLFRRRDRAEDQQTGSVTQIPDIGYGGGYNRRLAEEQQQYMPTPDERAVRGGAEDEAYMLGERMGAEETLRRQGAMIGSAPGSEPAGGVTKDKIMDMIQVLLKYKSGKISVDRRVVANQQWWKLKNWEMIEMERGTKGATTIKSNTAWLWNCIVGKHADAIDCYPEPIILPREESDKDEAKMLSDIVPVVMQMNDFEETYNDCQWQKLQEGTAVYGVFWDKSKLNGLGDIAIRKVNILNLFWEPGITDIQESKNVFYVYMADDDELAGRYPQLRGKLGSQGFLTAKYLTDDFVPEDGKSVVVDWYYHKWENGQKTLHLCKFCNGEILYSTENEGIKEGLYTDGNYPFVLDPLFPVEGSPAGYGYIDIGRDTQTDIDTLSQAMVLNAVANATPRHFIRKDGGVNEEEFADWSKPFVHVGGINLGDDYIRPVQSVNMSGNAMNMLQQKIDELKFITGNTDVNNGGVPSGVTAASAIAALKEDSGRSSKDSTKASYRSYSKIVTMVIERIRQFYDLPRQFRITGRGGNQEEFVQFSNEKMKPQPLEEGLGLEGNMRLPVFDVDVRAQRENAYTKMSQNELAIQFLQLGFMNPQMSDQALMALDMMDFKGKEELMTKIREQGTLMDAFSQVSQIALALAQKYDPAIAMQLGGVMQGVMGDVGMAPAGEIQQMSMQTPDNTEAADRKFRENPIVTRAKERSANATRPD